MIRCRKKDGTVENAEGVFYTKENIDEIKIFLGKCFKGFNKFEELWFKEHPKSDFCGFATPYESMIIKEKYKNTYEFYDEPLDVFLKEWELIK